MRTLAIAMCAAHANCVSVKDGVTTTHYTDVDHLTIDLSLSLGRAQSETPTASPDSANPPTGTDHAVGTEGRAPEDTAPASPTPDCQRIACADHPLETHPDSDPLAAVRNWGMSAQEALASASRIGQPS